MAAEETSSLAARDSPFFLGISLRGVGGPAKAPLKIFSKRDGCFMGILSGVLPKEDKWPDYLFNPGPAKHLHAVGVISSCFNSFERILFDLFMHHIERKKLPRAVAEQYYLSLAEQRRVTAIRDTFRQFERKPKVVRTIENLLEYFEWCHNVRNSVAHGEAYPSLLSDATLLKLVKRPSKLSPLRGYLSLDLPTIRGYADKVEAGRYQAARINVHLRYRDTKPSHRSPALRMHGPEPLPKILEIPEPVVLLAHPHSDSAPLLPRRPLPG